MYVGKAVRLMSVNYTAVKMSKNKFDKRAATTVS